jgi:hypothetical protein
MTDKKPANTGMGRPSSKQPMADEKPADNEMQTHEETTKMGMGKQPVSTRQPIEVPPKSPQPKKPKKRSQLGLKRATKKATRTGRMGKTKRH